MQSRRRPGAWNRVPGGAAARCRPFPPLSARVCCAMFAPAAEWSAIAQPEIVPVVSLTAAEPASPPGCPLAVDVRDDLGNGVVHDGLRIVEDIDDVLHRRVRLLLDLGL